MIRVGLAGIGFMGWIHWLAYQKVASAQVTAICSRNPQKRAGDWTDIQGNFGPHICIARLRLRRCRLVNTCLWKNPWG